MNRNFFLLILITLLFLAIPTSLHAQDIVQFQGDIEILEDQLVEGNIVAMTGNIINWGKVQGDITAFKGDVILKDHSTVEGNITVFAGKVIQSTDAFVKGSISDFKNKGFQVVTQNTMPQVQYVHKESGLGGFLMQLLGLAALTVLGLSFFGTGITNMNGWLQENLGNVLVKGFLGWLALPFLLIALLVTIIGIPIAALTIFLIPVSFVIGLWVVGLFTGEKVAFMLKPAWQDNLLIKGLLGVLIIWLAIKAPFIGFLVIPVVAIIGLGVILDSKFGTGKPWFGSKKGDL